MKDKKRILILIIIAIIIFVALVLLRNAIIKNKEENRILNSYEDLKNAQDVIRYVGGKYLGEKNSTDENFTLDIYAKFDRDLYTGQTSNEEYYKNLVKLMAYTLKFDSFRIADEEKNILIAVVCNKDNSSIERTYINGYDNYYARQNSELDYEKMLNNTTKVTNFNIQAQELIQLINNNWSKNTINLVKTGEYNGYTIDDNNGIALKSTYRNVFNIVFRENYSGNILNNINTGMELDEIKKILGEPTFDAEETAGVIGYIGNDIYAFFELRANIYISNQKL